MVRANIKPDLVADILVDAIQGLVGGNRGRHRHREVTGKSAGTQEIGGREILLQLQRDSAEMRVVGICVPGKWRVICSAGL